MINKISSDYFPLIVASLITALAMISLFFVEEAMITGPLLGIVPGLSYGLGLFFVFLKKKRGTNNYLLKAVALIGFSVFGYYLAYQVTMIASVIPFLGAFVGCLLGSVILALGLEFSFGKLSTKAFSIIIWSGAILGAVLTIPTSINFLDTAMSSEPEVAYIIFPVATWQFLMSFFIVNNLNGDKKEKEVETSAVTPESKNEGGLEQVSSEKQNLNEEIINKS